MERRWTEEQKDVINARGGTLLVSAAAGSGKTTVLVQRVIERITAPDGCDADRLLVVTFTRAAAAEMKQRIEQRILELLSERPEDLRLQRQKLLLERAQISTVHSFCADLIRENFSRLGLSPTFRLATEDEMALLGEQAAQDVAEEAYAEGRRQEAFRELVELFSGDRDDSKLTETVRKLYDFVRSHPFPEQWLEEKAASYDPTRDPLETPWCQILLQFAREQLEAVRELLHRAEQVAQEDDAVWNAYSEALSEDRQLCARLDAMAADRQWDAFTSLLQQLPKSPVKRLGKGKCDESVKERASELRKHYWKILEKLTGTFSRTLSEIREDIAAQAPQAAALTELCRRYGERLDALKREKNILDFGDLEHFALKLLVRPTENGYERTETAREISEKYEEVMVDEYQDTNGAQDLIFSAVSREERNLFFVGDVKQSIYRFRQASPELFLKRREEYPHYDRNLDHYPATVILGANFRSRPGITRGCNDLFHLLMSRDAAEMDYTAEEELVAKASYPPSEEPDMELRLLDTSQYEGTCAEAEWIAAKIQQMLREGARVWKDENTSRPAEYRDFCILLRSAANYAQDYAKILAARGIPVWLSAQGGFFSAREISIVLSLLRVIDNPLQDIPLLAVLLSPIGGFTPEDAAIIRMKQTKGLLYHALVLAAEEDERCRSFLQMTEKYRRLAATLPSDQLLRCIIRELHLEEMVLALQDGGSPLANLRMLLEYARTYEQAGYRGLSGFIRYIDRLQEQRSDLAQVSALSENANVVRIMSIHHSKGLEFPFVFLADTARKFNRQSQWGNLLIHPELGVGFKRRDPVSGGRFATAAHTAISLKIGWDELAEQLRVLYVAVTRAREKLFILVSEKNPDKMLHGLAGDLTEQGRLPAFALRNGDSFADWILSALMHLSGGAKLRHWGAAEDLEVLPGGDWTVERTIPHWEDFQTEEKAAEVVPDEEFLQYLRRIMAEPPVSTLLSKVPVKAAISRLAEEQEDRRHLGQRRPKFLTGEGLSPAERGTALHRFLQFADYRAAATDSQGECRRLQEKGFLTVAEGESIDCKRVDALFSGPLGQQIFAAEKVHREVRFFREIPAKELEPSLTGPDGEETVLLQGVADCVLEKPEGLVLIDYKTDRVSDGAALIRRYGEQLRHYQLALEETFGKPVVETVIYSLWLSEEFRL